MSFRSQFDSPVIDAEGNALADIEATVYESDGTSEATIYASRTGGSTVANPILTDVNGLVQFWAEPGTYVVEFHDTEVPARVSDRSVYWEAVSGDADTGGVDLAQLERGGANTVLKTVGSGSEPVWAAVDDFLPEEYSVILHAGGYINLDAASGTYLLGSHSGSSGNMGRSGATDPIDSPPTLIRFVQNDYKKGSKSVKLRIRAQVASNATAPAINFTFGMHLISSAGAADTQIYTADVAVTNSTVAINTPSASTVSNAVGSQFDAPSDGNYGLCVLASGVLANNSHVSCHAILQVINN